MPPPFPKKQIEDIHRPDRTSDASDAQKEAKEEEDVSLPKESRRSPYLALKGIPILSSRISPALYEKVQAIQNKHFSAEEEKEEAAMLAFDNDPDCTEIDIKPEIADSNTQMSEQDKIFLESRLSDLKITAEITFQQLESLAQQPIMVPCPRSPWDPTWYQVHKVAGDILSSLRVKEE